MTITEAKVSNYFGLPEEYSSPENSKVVIVPCPYEATTSYGKGTKNGPKAVLTASQQVELFDEELWIESCKIGVQTAEEVVMPPQTGEMEKPFQALYETVAPLVEFNKFPVVIGGEHSLSIGAVRACAERFSDLSILHIDAHADLRQSYDGQPYSHATAAYHLYNIMPNPCLTQVGIRNISSEEVEWLESSEPNINIFWARNQDRWNFHEIVHTLSDNVYLTIDVDGLDSSVMPSTGTPEPGGMTWYQLMELIKLLCVRKNVVAADVVELAPIANMHAPDFLVAKMIYKMIGYRYALELGVTKKYL